MLEKAGALVLQLGLLALALLSAVWGSAWLVSMDIGASSLAAAVAGTYLIALAHGAVALLVGAATGSRTLALGVAAAVAVAGYLLNGLGQIAAALEPWRVLSPFEWLGTPVRDGLPLSAAALAVAAAAAVALAPALFDRRDVAV